MYFPSFHMGGEPFKGFKKNIFKGLSQRRSRSRSTKLEPAPGEKKDWLKVHNAARTLQLYTNRKIKEN